MVTRLQAFEDDQMERHSMMSSSVGTEMMLQSDGNMSMDGALIGLRNNINLHVVEERSEDTDGIPKKV